MRRVTGLLLVLAAAGGVVSFAPVREVVVAPVVAPPRPVPPSVPVPLPVDPAHAIVYQRGYETRDGRRALVERWVLAGTAFRERTIVDGVIAQDRGNGYEVDHGRGEWRAGAARGLDGDCARTPEEVRAGLADGTATESGTGVPIAGHETMVVRHHGTPAVDLWLHADTGRPLRCRVVEPDSTMFDLVWLPPTEANLAQLVVMIPDGFTAVTGRGESGH